MDPKVHGQILKVRDDRRPVFLKYSPVKPNPVAALLRRPQAEPNTDKIELHPMHSSSRPPWMKDDTIKVDELRAHIEPWLTSLVQSEHLSLLTGAGLTRAVHQIATKEKYPVSDEANFTVLKEEISQEVKKITEKAGRKSGNIEDQIRVVNELLRGLKILGRGEFGLLNDELERELQSFTNSILEGERNIVKPAKRKTAFNYLVNFLMSFASRTGTRERLHLFTTNYDRIIEAGADVAGLRLIDRFVGTLTPVFRASRLDVDMHYNPPGIRGEPRYLEGVARFTKLHGSVDWLDFDRAIQRIGIPFGAENIELYLGAPGLKDTDATSLMIYPNAAKDRETAAYPYVELFRDFAASICRPNSTLICYGYSFGDDHINRVIKDALTIPSTHLVIISYGDPLGRIKQIYKDIGRRAQITLLLGDHLGNLEDLVRHYLPKPAIDNAMFRMAKLLKDRFGTANTNDNTEDEK